MLKNITRILPFLIITILCIGGVELFYTIIERFLLVPQESSQEKQRVAKQTAATPKGLEQHSNFQVILDRNLFRSYLKGDATASTPGEEKKENPLEGLEATTLELILMGTIAGPAEQSRAVIMEKGNKKQDIYYAGDVIQQAMIKEILRGKIILSYNGKDEILDMSEASSVRPKNNTPKKQIRPRKSVSRPTRRPVARRTPAAVKTRQKLPSAKVTEENRTDQDSDTADPEQDVAKEEDAEQEPSPQSEDDSERNIDRDGREL